MLELFIANSGLNSDNNKKLTSSQKRSIQVAYTIVIIMYILLFTWAITRALKCSSNNPDSRVIHLFFATACPVLYIIFSYTITGFCNI